MTELKQSQVVELTGVAAETLQAWIKRGLIRFAGNGTGNHRAYDFPAVAHVAIMVAATRQGVRASDAASIAVAAVPTLLATMTPPRSDVVVIGTAAATIGPMGGGVIGYAGGTIRVGGWPDDEHAPQAFLAINVAAIGRTLVDRIAGMGLPAPDPIDFASSLWGRMSP